MLLRVATFPRCSSADETVQHEHDNAITPRGHAGHFPPRPDRRRCSLAAIHRQGCEELLYGTYKVDDYALCAHQRMKICYTPASIVAGDEVA